MGDVFNWLLRVKLFVQAATTITKAVKLADTLSLSTVIQFL